MLIFVKLDCIKCTWIIVLIIDFTDCYKKSLLTSIIYLEAANKLYMLHAKVILKLSFNFNEECLLVF